MAKQYITTNVRLPRVLYKTLKRRAAEEDKSLAFLVRAALIAYNNPVVATSRDRKINGQDRLVKLADLAKLAAPLGGDISSQIDKIVYG